jgi:5-(carboxyamino)imidazole ribonucleotide synthase
MWQGKKLGILGGGQLGTMLVRSAIDFGLQVFVLDKNPDAPCSRYTGNFVAGDLMDYETVMAFGRMVEVLTIEIEAVNVAALRDLASEGIIIAPDADLIGTIQDKWTQKQALLSAGIPVVPGISIADRKSLYALPDKLPGCLKLRTQGYDGNGVMMLHTPSDFDRAFDAPCVLEELVQIDRELAVIVCRNAQGDIVCYDPVQMVLDGERHLLDYQLCPASITAGQSDEARDIATRVAISMNLVGILAVEMFLTSEGKILVNELAPRPHNSGHHTIEACNTSQYEQLLRAALGLPLGDTAIIQPSVMVNILEPEPPGRKALENGLSEMLGQPGTHIHWYGKPAGRPGRKMGHITITGRTLVEVLEKATDIRSLVRN